MIETKSRLNDNSVVACESKKHWVVFVIPFFMIIVGLFFMLTTMKYYIMAGIVIILFSVMKILDYKSSKWILTKNELIIKSGFMPWKKTYFDIPIENIFEAYYEHDLLSNIFGYGHLNIRRTDGSTSTFRTTKMKNQKKITSNINTMVRELKNQEKIMNIPQSVVSTVDELYKLSQLKQQGVLTDEEFERMKQKLIN